MSSNTGLACGLAHFTGVLTVSGNESKRVSATNISSKPSSLNETGFASVADDITVSATDMSSVRAEHVGP